MSTKTNDFESYFTSIQSTNKIGDLENETCKLISVAEYKSSKSGKTSLKIVFNKDGSEFSSYLGLASDKSIDITNGRLIKLYSAATSPEDAMEAFKSSFEDEDNDHDTKNIAIDFATKLNKKLKKNPVEVIVTRHKNEEGLWNVKWKIKSEDDVAEASETKIDEPALTGESKVESKVEPEKTDAFLDDLK